MHAALPCFGWVRAQAHPRVAQQRDAHDLLEIRYIAMPPQRRARLVLGDRRVVNASDIETSPRGKLLAQRVKERRDRRSVVQSMVRKIVAPSIARDSASGLPFAVLCVLKGQGFEGLQQGGFVRDAQEVRLIGKPLRKRCFRGEEIGLHGPKGVAVAMKNKATLKRRGRVYGRASRESRRNEMKTFSGSGNCRRPA
jgi:hypothetical protein